MSNTNYVIMTVASVDFSYRETMAKLMSSYSKDLIAKAGAKGTRFGSIGTGEHAGSLLFIQFYDDLNGYQKGLEMQGNSSQFKEIMSSGKANIYLRNIATSLQTKFEQSAEHPKYIVMTRAEASMSDKEKSLLKEIPNYFYEVTFEKPGGLVMPIIVELEYKDGTKERHNFPAQIWRYNDKEVSKVFKTTKEIKKITIDPDLETADIDTSNNSWPKKDNSKFNKFRKKLKG